MKRAVFVAFVLAFVSTDARIIKRESPDTVIIRTYISNPNEVSFQSKSRFPRDSTSYSSSNNVFLKSSSTSNSQQPLSTTYISSPSSGSSSFSSPVSSTSSGSTSFSSPVSSTSSGSTSFSSPSSSISSNSYISSSSTSSVSTPSLTITVPSSSSSSSTSSSAAALNPLAGLTALLSPKSGGGGSGGAPDILGGIGGALTAASGGVKTALEIKRDVIIPLILGIFDLLKNFASSDTLQTIANAKLNAARSALTIGPTIIGTLGELARSAGDVTNSIIKIILCNIICPLQEDTAGCKVQSTCDVGSSSTSSSLKTSYVSSPSSTYIVS